VAEAGETVSEAQLKGLVRTLLVERFRLRLHQEQQELQVSALVVGSRTTGLYEVAGGGDPQEYFVSRVWMLKNQTMSNFGDAFGAAVGRKVVDMTGMEGAFDVNISLKDFSPQSPQDPNYANSTRYLDENRGDALSTFLTNALDQQLGLRLEPRTLPFQALIIDDGNRTPMGN
jgi:uncharacterized protein (TIGR03435 family)